MSTLHALSKHFPGVHARKPGCFSTNRVGPLLLADQQIDGSTIGIAHDDVHLAAGCLNEAL